MTKLKTLIATTVVAGALVAPATSQAQINVGTVCNSLLGSGTTELGVASVDRCLAANEPEACSLNDTIDVLGLVRIRHGLCLSLEQVLATRKASVRGLVTARILP